MRISLKREMNTSLAEQGTAKPGLRGEARVQFGWIWILF